MEKNGKNKWRLQQKKKKQKRERESKEKERKYLPMQVLWPDRLFPGYLPTYLLTRMLWPMKDVYRERFQWKHRSRNDTSTFIDPLVLIYYVEVGIISAVPFFSLFLLPFCIYIILFHFILFHTMVMHTSLYWKGDTFLNFDESTST